MEDIIYSEAVLPGGVRQVALSGSLDSKVNLKRGDDLYAFITQGGGSVLVDLSALDYISSGGIGTLIRCLKTLNGAGGALHLAAPQPRVRSAIDIVASFLPDFPMHATLDEALAALSG